MPLCVLFFCCSCHGGRARDRRTEQSLYLYAVAVPFTPIPHCSGGTVTQTPGTFVHGRCSGIDQREVKRFVWSTLSSSVRMLSFRIVLSRAMSASAAHSGPVQTKLSDKLLAVFEPVTHFVIENESYKHNVPTGR